MTGAVEEVDGVEEIRKAVRRNIRDGADCIKPVSYTHLSA